MADVKCRVVIRKQDRIDYILNGICDFYGQPREDFGRKYVRNPQKFNAKRFAMLILYDIADCTLKDINYALNYSNSTALVNTHTHIANLREDLAKYSQGHKELKEEYKRLLNHLKL